MKRSDYSNMFMMHPEGSPGDLLAIKIASEVEKELGFEVTYGIETTDREVRFLMFLSGIRDAHYMSFGPIFVQGFGHRSPKPRI